MKAYPLQGTSLLVDVADGVATVTLNRPEQHNALSRELRTNLAAALEALQDDDDVRVIILTGAGEKSFCVGLDLKEFERDPLHPEEMGPNSRMMRAFARLRKPTIGAINGYAVTGGFELTCNCDIVVGSTRAKFGDTHVRVGVLPGWGISQNLPRIIGPMRARYLCFTGNYLDAATAKEWGLLLEVVEPSELLPYCRKLAREMSSADQSTLQNYREIMRAGWMSTANEGIELEGRLGQAELSRVDVANFGSTRERVMGRGKEQAGG